MVCVSVRRQDAWQTETVDKRCKYELTRQSLRDVTRNGAERERKNEERKREECLLTFILPVLSITCPCEPSTWCKPRGKGVLGNPSKLDMSSGFAIVSPQKHQCSVGHSLFAYVHT